MESVLRVTLINEDAPSIVRKFDSMSSAATFMRVSPNALYRHWREKTPKHGWYVKYDPRRGFKYDSRKVSKTKLPTSARSTHTAAAKKNVNAASATTARSTRATITAAADNNSGESAVTRPTRGTAAQKDGDAAATQSNAPLLPFKEAASYARLLKLKDQGAWRAWAKSSARPSRICSNPGKTYRYSGWQGYAHWLGCDDPSPQHARTATTTTSGTRPTRTTSAQKDGTIATNAKTRPTRGAADPGMRSLYRSAKSRADVGRPVTSSDGHRLRRDTSHADSEGAKREGKRKPGRPRKHPRASSSRGKTGASEAGPAKKSRRTSKRTSDEPDAVAQRAARMDRRLSAGSTPTSAAKRLRKTRKMRTPVDADTDADTGTGTDTDADADADDGTDTGNTDDATADSASSAGSDDASEDDGGSDDTDATKAAIAQQGSFLGSLITESPFSVSVCASWGEVVECVMYTGHACLYNCVHCSSICGCRVCEPTANQLCAFACVPSFLFLFLLLQVLQNVQKFVVSLWAEHSVADFYSSRVWLCAQHAVSQPETHVVYCVRLGDSRCSVWVGAGQSKQPLLP